MNLRMKESDKLRVRMFGTFDMIWHGESITGKRSSGTQFFMLMQMLIHFRREGVSREFLQNALFDGTDVTDRNHALQSVLYNAKKRLQEAGMADVRFVRKKAVYYWDEAVPVTEDTTVFERYFEQSMSEKDAEKKLWLLLRTAYTYKGMFLEQYQSVPWVKDEATRYQGMFRRCMEVTASILRGIQDYPRLEELGRHAAQVDPLQSWEALALEGLYSQGKYEAAVKLYGDTSEYYMEANRTHPSQEMSDWMDRIREQIVYPFDTLDQIQNRIGETKESINGAFFCSFPIFQNIYRVCVRTSQRTGMRIVLMLCNIVDGNGNLKNDAQLPELAERLENAITGSIRKGDVFTKYNKNQFLILLAGAAREDCRGIQNRINHHFLSNRQRTRVNYYVSEVTGELRA